MSTVTIPLDPSEPFLTQTTALDGVEYTLRFRYNQRQRRYFLDIGSKEGAMYATGAALVIGWPLFTKSRDSRMPRGVLIIVASGADTWTSPALGELGPGKRCELLYVSGGAAL